MTKGFEFDSIPGPLTDLPGQAPERAAILVVDDLPEKLLVFGTVLEPLGQELVFVSSGREALREVLKREFAVILLDVNMPDVDGFETATLIRRYRRSAHTPIIFITAYADEMQTARGYSLGAVDYILSPVVPEILCSKIQVFVDLFLLRKRISRQADERVALASAEAARLAAEADRRRSDYLARASRELSDSLDVDLAARKLLELVVPQLAEMAATVLLADQPGEAPDAQAPADAEADMGKRPVRSWVLAYGGDKVHESRAEALALQALPEPVQSISMQVLTDKVPTSVSPQGLSPMLTAAGIDTDGPPFTSALGLPLMLGERALGLLLVSSRNALDERLLDELATRAAPALENARLYCSLQAEIIERRAAEAKLQASNRRKDEFLAMLSHELRNPLAPIRNAVEIMRRTAPPDARLRWANNVMERQVGHLTRLVEELLDVARISQGKISLHPEPVDLLTVIEHAVETARPFIEERHHQLKLSLPTSPLWLRGDFARLSQVVANLLNNAAKYTEAGGAIELAMGVDDGEALITVSDNGMGIEPELLPHVFELFEQGQRALDRSQGGLGVGLTLVQRLVELHQGRVEASSGGLNQGAQFRIWLPCISTVQTPRGEEARSAQQRATPEGCRVLIVDDNVDAAESIGMVLSLYGHEVKTVPDGHQALACLGTFAPHAVVLDIGLPGMDGYEVARQIRRHPQQSNVILIALTGYGQREDVQRANDAGFDKHFVKPADPEELAACVAQIRGQQDLAQSPAPKRGLGS